MQGALPLASPRLSRKQHGLTLRKRYPAGGLPSLPPARPAFSLLSFPHPPSPLPGGKGETFGFLCKGLRPLHPRGLNPRGAGSTCWGFLSGRFYKCRTRSNAGVPGAKPPATLTFNLPLPDGKGGGGVGAGKKAKGWAGRRQRRYAPLRLPEGQGRRAAKKASPPANTAAARSAGNAGGSPPPGHPPTPVCK